MQQHHSSSRSSHQHICREQQDYCYYYYYYYYYYFRAMVFFVPGADFFDAVFLLVSCFIRGSSSNQNWRSKLDKIRFLVGFQKGRFGLRGTISSRISEGTLRLPGNLLLRLILHHFRHEIRWCFAVSAVFRRRCLAAGFLLYWRQQQQSKLEIKIGQNWLSSRVSEGTFRPPGNRLLRLILRHFRHEIRWCFAVSAVFRKRCLAAGFWLY